MVRLRPLAMAIAFVLTVSTSLALPGGSVGSTPVPPTPDLCAGMSFAQVIVGSDGADTFGPFNQSTLVFGLGGDDVLFGGTAADCLSGGDGTDILHGGNGADRLLGDAGSDRIFGDNGPDHIDGGPDADLCVGGNGPNVIVNCESTSATDPCDPDGVAIEWDARPTGLVPSARILDVEAACAGKAITLDVRDASGTLIARSGRLLTVDGPLAVVPTPLFVPLPGAPCDPSSCTVQLAPVDPSGAYAGGHGVDGARIEAVDVSIVVAP